MPELHRLFINNKVKSTVFYRLIRKAYYGLKYYRLTINKILTSPFRSLKPISTKFGSDRGTPIVRYYIKDFLSKNTSYISGDILEMSEPLYAKKFGKGIKKIEVLHLTPDNISATLIRDLTNIDSLPIEQFDCFICTQTLQFIYDWKNALIGSYRMLKKGGVMLTTINGISQISLYDMERWGEYWRFTVPSAKKSFEEVFGKDNVTVEFYGNCLSSCSALKGMSAEELTKKELDYKDSAYPFLITIMAKK